MDQVVAQALTVFKKISGEKKAGNGRLALARRDLIKVETRLQPSMA
jgi:hypothetical protein